MVGGGGGGHTCFGFVYQKLYALLLGSRQKSCVVRDWGLCRVCEKACTVWCI